MKVSNARRAIAVGIFQDHASAQAAVRELRNKGFLDSAIGVASRNTHEKIVENEITGGRAETGAAVGVVTGASVGALWGLGVVAGMLPAIGPVIAGGTLAAILASSAIGAGAAGLTGALIGLGIPEEEARHYESEFHAGRTIVSVKTGEERYPDALAILRKHGAASPYV